MAEGLSMAARREITKKFARDYAKVGKAEKSRLLDSLVETTGWTRDHARRAIRRASARVGAARDQERKPRPRKYSYDALVVLQEVWRLAGQPSGKYLAAVMDDTLGRLVRFGELGKVAARVSDAVLDELRAMSAATIDRYLKPHKDAAYPVALSGTKPSHILRSSIPTRTSMDAPITTPGFLELDTVAHCGHTLKGEFLRTLTATDPLTGWTMLRSIRNNAYVHVHGALEWMTGHTPVPVAGMDFDNGSEFMNWAVIAWADKRDIPLTRGRPYKHNDNAHVECPASSRWQVLGLGEVGDLRVGVAEVDLDRAVPGQVLVGSDGVVLDPVALDVDGQVDRVGDLLEEQPLVLQGAEAAFA